MNSTQIQQASRLASASCVRGLVLVCLMATTTGMAATGSDQPMAGPSGYQSGTSEIPAQVRQDGAGSGSRDVKTYKCAYVAPRGDAYKLDQSLCPAKGEKKNKVLIPDEGAVTVVLAAADYDAALRAHERQLPQLYLSGMDLGGAAAFDGLNESKDEVALTYRVSHVDSKQARDFWSSVFQRTGFAPLSPLYVTLGWPANPDYFQPPTINGITDSLLIASGWTLIIGVVLGLIIVGGFVSALLWSNTFRVGPRLQTGQRQAYSFARVQWGVWITFTITGAVFLTVIYGSLPPLSSTVLALAGVSTLAATASFFMDAQNPSLPEPSAGFLNDLLSGSGDSTAQAHRFQALAVNVAMLLAAIFWIYRHLGYPEFDPTWLALLGISDAAHLIGKNQLEGSPPTPAGGPRPLPTPAPPPPAPSNPPAGQTPGAQAKPAQ